MLLEEHVDIALEGDIADILLHVLVEVVSKIRLDKTFELLLGHDVVGVPLDSVLTWVRVVVHRLVHEHGDVHGHRVPPGVLVIDDNKFTVVLHGHEDVVLVAIVVGQHVGERINVITVKMDRLIRFRN